VHPLAGSQPSVVHGSPSSQLTATFEQLPPEHESVVHAFESSQLIGVAVQPLAGSQASVVQASPSSQLTATFEQLPPEHESVVQALESSQLIGVFEQPVAESQASVVQASPSSQLTAPPGTHAATLLQRSGAVQASPSEQGAPGLTVLRQAPLLGLHVSVVHWLPSEQSFGVPAMQMPLSLHSSCPSVHWLPSEQFVLGCRFSWMHSLTFVMLHALNLQLFWPAPGRPKGHAGLPGVMTCA
jgi:hypothetical protein